MESVARFWSFKPENHFVTKEGRIKIVDFGLAKLGRADQEASSPSTSATEPGVVMGTVWFSDQNPQSRPSYQMILRANWISRGSRARLMVPKVELYFETGIFTAPVAASMSRFGFD